MKASMARMLSPAARLIRRCSAALRRRALIRAAADAVMTESERAIPRWEILQTLRGYSTSALRVLSTHLHVGPGPGSGIMAEAVCRDLPEGFVWVREGMGHRPAGDWTHSWNQWFWTTHGLIGAFDDPVLSAPLRGLKGPSETVARIGAVLAVIAESEALEQHRRPVSRTRSRYVVEGCRTDRTEWLVLPRQWNAGDPTLQLRNPELTALVFERPEHAYRIAHLMEERSTDDADMIRSILDADAPVLADGML